MRIPSWIVSLIALLALAGCSSYAVVSDYDSSMPFGSYKSYRWSGDGSAGIEDDALARNPLIYKHIRAAVNRELQAKGFVLKETGPVDFLVSTHAGIRERVTVGPPTFSFSYHRGYYRRGFGYYPAFWYDPYWPYPQLTYYEEGTVIIDVIDAKRNDIAWRGVVTSILNNHESPEEMHRQIDISVMKVLAKFPPLTR
jgi:hypothetical protein